MKCIVFLSFSLFLFGCSKKSREVPNANLLPPAFDFVILDSVDDSSLVTSQTQNIKLWYVLDGETRFVEDVKIQPTIHSMRYPFYITTVLAPLKSSENVAKAFYIQIDDHKTDTILLDVVRLSQPVEREYNRYKQIKLNGKVGSLELDHEPALWVLQR